MARIAWGTAGQRYFETGLDRGVFYLPTEIGVPWNGLIAVNEKASGGKPRPFYLDGVKVLNLSGAEEFAATIQSFFAPSGFEACDGTQAISNGLFLTQQTRKPFSFSYRTLLGNDVDGTDHAYKIHLVYNALAAAGNTAHKTLDSNAEATPLSWEVTTLPPAITGYRPTAHFVIDSRISDPTALSTIEDILYGSIAENAHMPTVSELLTIFGG